MNSIQIRSGDAGADFCFYMKNLPVVCGGVGLHNRYYGAAILFIRKRCAALSGKGAVYGLYARKQS